MKISIIIPTYNERLDLGKCIESLKQQTQNNFEIIIVDDGSNDGTFEILKKFKKNGDIKFIKQNHNGAGSARNLGAKQSTGQILVFVDADMTFDRDFLKNLVKPIQVNPTPPRLRGARGTFSKEEIVSNWDSVWSRCWNINEGWEVKKRHPKNYPDHQPVFRAILKSEFDRVSGFTPGGYDDDWSLGKKLGYEAVTAPGAVFYHQNPSSLFEIFNHAKWVGKRKYKLGIVGNFIGIFRSLLPFSIIIGLIKGVKNKELRFIIFKIVYDFGIILGIIQYLLTKKQSK